MGNRGKLEGDLKMMIKILEILVMEGIAIMMFVFAYLSAKRFAIHEK